MTTKGSPHQFGTIPPGDPSKVRGSDDAIDAAFARLVEACGGDKARALVLASHRLANGSPPPDNWRDIDTAPVDGTEVLVWRKATAYSETEGYSLALLRAPADRENERNIWGATKWQPLPAPPKGCEP